MGRKLWDLGYYVETDARNESMGLKTRECQKAKIPFALVAGDREMEEGTFAVRKYGERESQTLTEEQIVGLFEELRSLPKLPPSAMK